MPRLGSSRPHSSSPPQAAPCTPAASSIDMASTACSRSSCPSTPSRSSPSSSPSSTGFPFSCKHWPSRWQAQASRPLVPSCEPGGPTRSADSARPHRQCFAAPSPSRASSMSSSSPSGHLSSRRWRCAFRSPPPSCSRRYSRLSGGCCSPLSEPPSRLLRPAFPCRAHTTAPPSDSPDSFLSCSRRSEPASSSVPLRSRR